MVSVTLGALRDPKKLTSDYRDLINKFQFVREYVHAVWSSRTGEFAKGDFEQAKATELQEKCEKLRMTVTFYAMASSQSINQANSVKFRRILSFKPKAPQ
ncbi:hypothetical protein XI07_15710 [Bradyrhizobium sp. CCBAU 11445]|uniref:hypothetical protein n=1 Tax=unclassified Bradyrhizobium TaxID=2631580 RepID=UPI002306C4E7|nr:MULTISPECIES: hypothetical protein [unclassified Bradyrhizobium]MDA9483433.1 hypothetical protein [Bradyrhizobium sp. CCBAU 11445]MDA9523333.1 hypothetical protein [Bradyrhizobium sp. CCBAU 11434]